MALLWLYQMAKYLLLLLVMVYVHTNQHLNLYFFVGNTNLYLDVLTMVKLLLVFDRINLADLSSKQVDGQAVELQLAYQSSRQLLDPKYRHKL